MQAKKVQPKAAPSSASKGKAKSGGGAAPRKSSAAPATTPNPAPQTVKASKSKVGSAAEPREPAVSATKEVRQGRASKAAPKSNVPKETTETASQAQIQPAATRQGRGKRASVAVAPAAVEPSSPEPALPTEPDVLLVESKLVESKSTTSKSARRGKKTSVQSETIESPSSEPANTVAPVRSGRQPKRQPIEVQAEEAAPALSLPQEAQQISTETPPKKARGGRTRRADATPVDVPVETVTLLTNAQSGEDVAELESGAGADIGAVVTPTVSRTRRTGKTASKPRRQSAVSTAPAEELEAAPSDPEDQEGRPTSETSSAHLSPAHEVSPEAKELITEQLRKLGRPVHVRDFERTFTRQGREKLGVRRDLAGLLEDLARSGDVIRTRRHTYGLPEAMNLVRGRFQASSAGFGFVIPDSGGDDFYIRENETLEAWNGDIVLIRPEGRGNDRPDYQGGRGRGGSRRDSSPRAAVVRIVSRAYSQLVGSLDHQQTYAFLKPDDSRARHRIMLMPDGTEGLPNGARIVTKLFWPEDTGEDEVYGEVTRVLGQEDDPATETQAVIVKYGLRDEFPENVLKEAERIPRTVSALSLKGRLDLRDYHIFTVDGSDAKDFDDAIHIQATPEGTFVVGVHIADVANYVTPDSAIDEEAYARATSVYLPGQVLPMLPEHLSNGVCSLVEGEDRLTMSALIELSADGDILKSTFTPSVIRSKARLTYDEVQAYSEAVATLQGSARILEGDLHLLLKITAKLRQKRLREGSLDFKLREVKVDVDKDGHMQLIPLREETARGMIEDLMLLANKAVAHFLLEKNVPTLYRIHEEPTMARFQDVTGAIGRMGLAFPGGEPTPQAYQAVLKSVRGTGQESAVNTLLLRSMQQAKYAGENLGHFGLAFDEYLHFTSPIRRYPDLLVHRALKEALNGPVSDKKRDDLAAPLMEQGRHTSERERTASEAERDLTKYYQAKWAQEHLDESFEGRVTGVIASGLFVALENGVEGRLHISNLGDDYYFYIEDASILKGRTSGRIYRIGESVDVTISSVNPLARQIDFTQPDPQENSMDGNDTKPRARRREDRQSQKREKLSSFLPRKDGETGETAASTTTEQSASASESGQQGQQQQFQRRDAQPGQGSGPRREDGDRNSNNDRNSDRTPRQGGQPRSAGGYRRRVITLDRPRNEHLRPVNVTVQRMYFGDWTIENMPPDEGQGGGGQYRSGGTFRGRGPQTSSGPRGMDRPRSDSRGEGNRSGGTSQGQGRSQQSSRPQAAAASAPSGEKPVSSEADEARRRRRRRGRRGGSGQSGGGAS
ncbi:ribonuclease R [Deinococcus sp.]|uniref:ribonuclease R n=1 Tax=Deinococcus sp. TaxID=47478 RepID=UPI003B5B371D